MSMWGLLGLGIDPYAVGFAGLFVFMVAVFAIVGTLADARTQRRNAQISLEMQRRELEVLARETTEADCRKLWEQWKREEEEGLDLRPSNYEEE